jgi:hypothetical protein
MRLAEKLDWKGLRVHQIRWFPCLKTETEAASETSCFIKKSDDGESSKGDCISDNYFCLPPVNRLQIMPDTGLYRMAFEVCALTTACCCKMWKQNYISYLTRADSIQRMFLLDVVVRVNVSCVWGVFLYKFLSKMCHHF